MNVRYGLQATATFEIQEQLDMDKLLQALLLLMASTIRKYLLP